MNLFTYHIIKLPFLSALRSIYFPFKANKIDGLIHLEFMSAMKLGSRVWSLSRVFSREVVVFAQWKDEKALNLFFKDHEFGRKIAKSWYLRLHFLRQWGSISGFDIPDQNFCEIPENEPIVAVTIARMKYLEIPRFLRWGRPVEKLVRDHEGTLLSLASIRYPNIISTFSIWKTQHEMTNMVQGHSNMSRPKRHVDAMAERERKDFHFEFTTLRFRPISEHNGWKGRVGFYKKK